MGLLDRFRKKTQLTDEERRVALLATGRITEGIIVDTESTADSEIVFYVYSLNGVDFESSQLLSDEQRRDLLKYAPGAKVSIRYDPKNQGNSILV